MFRLIKLENGNVLQKRISDGYVFRSYPPTALVTGREDSNGNEFVNIDHLDGANYDVWKGLIGELQIEPAAPFAPPVSLSALVEELGRNFFFPEVANTEIDLSTHSVTELNDVDNTTTATLKNNLNALLPPSAIDDSGSGYSVGSLWIDTASDTVYQCVDSSVGAAIWTSTSNTSSRLFYTTISPAQITGDQDNYSPLGISPSVVLRLDLDFNRVITGLDATSFLNMDLILLINISSAYNLKLKNNDAASIAENRFLMNGDLTIEANMSALLMYDTATLRFRIVSLNKVQ